MELILSKEHQNLLEELSSIYVAESGVRNFSGFRQLILRLKEVNLPHIYGKRWRDFNSLFPISYTHLNKHYLLALVELHVIGCSIGVLPMWHYDFWSRFRLLKGGGRRIGELGEMDSNAVRNAKEFWHLCCEREINPSLETMQELLFQHGGKWGLKSRTARYAKREYNRAEGRKLKKENKRLSYENEDLKNRIQWLQRKLRMNEGKIKRLENALSYKKAAE